MHKGSVDGSGANGLSVAIVMPKLGDVMEAGTVAKWLKDDGEWTAKGEPLFEVDADKISFVVDAVGSGFLRRLVREGVEASVGDVLGVLLSEEEAASSSSHTPGT